MAPEITADEILEKIKHRRKSILLTMFRHGELRTRELREKASVPSGSMEHHIGLLMEWGLVEEVGRTNESGGIPERIFGLTDQGVDFTDEYLTDEGERPDSFELRVERLEKEVDQLKTDGQQRDREIEDLKGTVSTLRDEFNDFVETVRDEWDRLASSE